MMGGVNIGLLLVTEVSTSSTSSARLVVGKLFGGEGIEFHGSVDFLHLDEQQFFL